MSSSFLIDPNELIKMELEPKKKLGEFFSCQHLLSDDEILEYLSGGDHQSERNNGKKNFDDRLMDTWRKHHHDSCDEHSLLRQAFYRRKAEIRKLAANLRDGLGGARIDEDGRLVPAMESPQPPRADLPPLGGVPNDNNIDNNLNNANANANDNPQFFPGNNLNQQENQEELFLAQKRLETELAIAQAASGLTLLILKIQGAESQEVFRSMDPKADWLFLPVGLKI